MTSAQICLLICRSMFFFLYRRKNVMEFRHAESPKWLYQISTYVLLLSCVSIVSSKQLAKFCVFPLLLCISIVLFKYDCDMIYAKITSIVMKTAVLGLLLCKHYPLHPGFIEAALPLLLVIIYGVVVDVPLTYGCPKINALQFMMTILFSVVAYLTLPRVEDVIIKCIHSIKFR